MPGINGRYRRSQLIQCVYILPTGLHAVHMLISRDYNNRRTIGSAIVGTMHNTWYRVLYAPVVTRPNSNTPPPNTQPKQKQTPCSLYMPCRPSAAMIMPPNILEPRVSPHRSVTGTANKHARRVERPALQGSIMNLYTYRVFSSGGTGLMALQSSCTVREEYIVF